jgi:broad specificity phosphatase PhoE
MHAEALSAALSFVKRSCRVKASLWNCRKPILPNSKVLHFIRHGQGYHNLIEEIAIASGAIFTDVADYETAVRERRFYLKPELQDPPLTARGYADARLLQAMNAIISPELIIASPLKRATQTILTAFSDQITGPSQIPVIALECCREQFGLYYSDMRSDVSQYIIEFPSINYEHITEDRDALWNPTERESMLAMCQRQEDFLDFVWNAPQKDIAVGTHSAWLYSLFNVVLDVEEADAAVLQPMFKTGELRSVVLTWQQESS